MAKLYPPYIEGTLPAFCVDVNTGDGVLTIPFAHNKAVSTDEILGIAIKVKTVQNDVLITSFTNRDVDGVYTDYENGSGDVVFTIKNFKINDWEVAIGQYYKIQLAYISLDTNEVGYYSTVGVVKCTSTPSVVILDFDPHNVNNNRIEFVGQFAQGAGGDVTEKVYSSNFVITDLNHNVIATSGEILHNVENNPNSYTSLETMSFNRDLNFGEIYKIVYNVTTTNGLEISSPEYLITQQRSLSSELKGNLIAKLNYDEGFVDVSIKGYVDKNGIEEIGNGSFVLAREDSVNPGVWEELCRFAFKYESPTKTIFRDFTIEQGKTYTYSIQQYNAKAQPKIYSDRKKSNSIYADFEDTFIYDGDKQLRLRFNPQVSSFKTQMSETRSETIGSKYPFFFRNARIGYKTFPVSGLISMLVDENQFFTKYSDILREDFTADRHDVRINRKLMPNLHSNTDLIAENYVSERLFKLKVLDWFNNGKVKLFKSPTEGNYLVRFMDTSMAPADGLGRMLHNLSTTAYESAEYNYKNMVDYGIIEDTSSNEDTTSAYVRQWREQNLGGVFFPFDKNDDGSYARTKFSENLLKADIDKPYTTILRFMDFLPGTKIRLVFDITGDYNIENEDLYEDVVIGATGNYFADEVNPIYGIYLINAQYKDNQKNIVPTNDLNKYAKVVDNDVIYGDFFNSEAGVITYEYDVPARNQFDLITSIQTDIGCYGQIVGECDNIIEHFNNIREQVTQVTMSNYHKRPIEYLYYGYKSWNDKIQYSVDDIVSYKTDNGVKYYQSILNETAVPSGEDDETEVIYNIGIDPTEEGNLFWREWDINSIVGQWWSEIDAEGYRSMRADLPNLYWTNDFNNNELFDDKESEQYSPFSFYVLKDSYINNLNVLDHIKQVYSKAYVEPELSHQVNHMFEKYYIDRYFSTKTPEEQLTQAMGMYKQYIKAQEYGLVEDAENLKMMLDAFPVFVLDAWNGNIYKVGEDWMYNPVVTYNNEEIDLRNIEGYSLDNLEIEDSIVSTGNGVYCEVFYQNVTKTYQLETAKLNEKVYNEKLAWQTEDAELKRLIKEGENNHALVVSQTKTVEDCYNTYLIDLEDAVNNWVALLDE